MERIKGLQIPRIEIFGTSIGVHTPTRQDPEGPIFNRLSEMWRSQQGVIMSAGEHALLGMPSLMPHHPDGSLVMWAARKTPHGLEEWKNPCSWQSLAADSEFLISVEETAKNFVNAGNSMYFFFGWAPENKNPEPGFARRGGMTQIRHHSHITPSLNAVQAREILEVTPHMSPEDRRILSIFLDYGSQTAHAHVPHLRDFSSHGHTWTQFDGRVQRHMHGFIHLQDAINQLVHLHMSLHGDWMNIARELYKKHSSDFLFPFDDGMQSLLMFPPVVSASICFPSPQDKQKMGIAHDDPCPVWVSPFSPVSKTALVDGVWLDRKSR